MKPGLFATVLLLVCACEPTIQWRPRSAKYVGMKMATSRAVVLYEGDVESLGRCNHAWIGDLFCSPRCTQGGHRIDRLAAAYGATHAMLLESGADRIGSHASTTLSATSAGGAVISGSETTVRDDYLEWERYRLYWIGKREQSRCLEPKLRYEP